jgi:hypothetical protein
VCGDAPQTLDDEARGVLRANARLRAELELQASGIAALLKNHRVRAVAYPRCFKLKFELKY